MNRKFAALADIKIASVASGASRRRTARQLQRFNPIFPVADLARALEHYSTLGFHTFAYADGNEYGFANREGTAVHLASDPDHDPSRNTAATYLDVRDADALYEEWSRPGIAGRTQPVAPTDYKLREGSHTDPDGNVIRFGSPIAE